MDQSRLLQTAHWLTYCGMSVPLGHSVYFVLFSWRGCFCGQRFVCSQHTWESTLGLVCLCSRQRDEPRHHTPLTLLCFGFFQANRRTKKQLPTSKHNSKPRIKVHKKKSTAIKRVQQIQITFSLCSMLLPMLSLQTTCEDAGCIEATIAQLSCRVHWETSAACGCNQLWLTSQALRHVLYITSCLVHLWGLSFDSRTEPTSKPCGSL